MRQQVQFRLASRAAEYSSLSCWLGHTPGSLLQSLCNGHVISIACCDFWNMVHLRPMLERECTLEYVRSRSGTFLLSY